jgi:hypothetical protein
MTVSDTLGRAFGTNRSGAALLIASALSAAAFIVGIVTFVSSGGDHGNYMFGNGVTAGVTISATFTWVVYFFRW